MSRWGLAILVVAVTLWCTTARAWDPSTTHLGMTERAVIDSGIHRHWMDASSLRRGLFSALQIDPARLSDQERRALILAFRQGHDTAGAIPLGGPGSCPGAKAPPKTRRYCIAADRWENTALGWLRAGILVESEPRDRLVHHFVNPENPAALTWEDHELAKGLLRHRQSRSNGAPLAGVFTGTNFDGSGPTALAWLADDDDPWSPARLAAHLEQASLSPDPRLRDHHLAMALVCAGALLHVVQDLSVPAHARGDASGFFAALSEFRNDRGLPVQEFARAQFGRATLPSAPLELGPRPEETAEEAHPMTARTVSELLLGHAGQEGLVTYAGRRFLSESSLPSPKALSADLEADEAAARLLAESNLHPRERDGARLAPWPAPTGYLQTRTGRPLAAYDTDPDGRIRLYLDRVVYLDQVGHLIPRGIEASRIVLEQIWPSPLELIQVEGRRATINLSSRPELQDPEVLVLFEDPRGQRVVKSRRSLKPGGTATLELPARRGIAGQPVVVVRAKSLEGRPWVIEQAVASEAKAPRPRDKAGIKTRPTSESPPTRPSAEGVPDAGKDDAPLPGGSTRSETDPSAPEAPPSAAGGVTPDSDRDPDPAEPGQKSPPPPSDSAPSPRAPEPSPPTPGAPDGGETPQAPGKPAPRPPPAAPR